MTRQQRIALNKRLGLDASRFEQMSDENYTSETDFQNEKHLKGYRDPKYRKIHRVRMASLLLASLFCRANDGANALHVSRGITPRR